MGIWFWVLIGVAAVAILIGLFVWSTQNSLTKLRVRVDEAWSDVLVQLKRRSDLTPNLVQSVQSYATHEREVLERIVEARSAVMSAADSGPQAMALADEEFGSALNSVLAVAEQYPKLKANENFLQLQHSLVTTEDKIQAARRFYTGTVRNLNIKVNTFPASLVARALGFTVRPFFEVDDPAALEKAATVEFSGHSSRPE
ncbi:MAG: LemA family protein [Propionibacteriaceae bacterium]|jgi:LemA protein|nr:LemA family protein [Propionibacteriaceae bacterium]